MAVGSHPKIELGPHYWVTAVEPHPKPAPGPSLSLSRARGTFLGDISWRAARAAPEELIVPPGKGREQSAASSPPPAPQSPRQKSSESRNPGPGGTGGDPAIGGGPAGTPGHGHALEGLAEMRFFSTPNPLWGWSVSREMRTALIPLPNFGGPGPSRGSQPSPRGSQPFPGVPIPSWGGVPALPGGPSPAPRPTQTRIRLNKRLN